MAVTYDKIDDNGKIINPNVRFNRVITDGNILGAVAQLEDFAGKLISES